MNNTIKFLPDPEYPFLLMQEHHDYVYYVSWN